MTTPKSIYSRREFLVSSAAALASPHLVCAAGPATPPEPIIDIHQHTNYGGGRDKARGYIPILPAPRSDADLVSHQRSLGVTKTILLPSGRSVSRPSTLHGQANGLDSSCSGNDDCVAVARQHPGEFEFGANEVRDLDDAPRVIEQYLNLGAVVIGEQKFSVECDAPYMQKLYALAAAYRVPILMHWQTGSYNLGFERFHQMLAKYSNVTFIGHAQTWWANIDRANVDNAKQLYPRGKVTPGGLTDRYLRDYPNMFGDLSAGSGLGAFNRDPEHARAFLERHQDKLMFGSDCIDVTGEPVKCSGARQLAQLRELAPTKAIERKLLFANAKRVFRF